MEQPVLTNPTQGLFIKLNTSATPVYLEGDAGGTNQPYEVFCVGSVAQTIYMPDPTQYFLNLGTRIDVLNNSSALVTLKGSDGSSITTLPPHTQSTITLSAANSNSWVYTNLTNLSLVSGILPIANGGTGPSLILPVANGGTGQNANITSQVANTVASWDSGANMNADLFIGATAYVTSNVNYADAASLPSYIYSYAVGATAVTLPGSIQNGVECYVYQGSDYPLTVNDGFNTFSTILWQNQGLRCVRINGIWAYDFSQGNIGGANLNLPCGYGASCRVFNQAGTSVTYVMGADWPSIIIVNFASGTANDAIFKLPAAGTIGSGTMYRFAVGTYADVITPSDIVIQTAAGTEVVRIGYHGAPVPYSGAGLAGTFGVATVRSCICTYSSNGSQSVWNTILEPYYDTFNA
jgi:hypothetical protein